MKNSKYSIRQEWARKRNWNKARLAGYLTTLQQLENDKSIVEDERDKLSSMISIVKTVISNYKRNNLLSRNNYEDIIKKGGNKWR